MYKLKRIKPQKKLIPLDIQIQGLGVKTLIIPHATKHVLVISYQFGLRIISANTLSTYDSTQFTENDFSQTDLSQIGINTNMLFDAGLTISMSSSFFLTNDQPNEYVLDAETYLDGTPEALDDCFIALLVIDKQFNYSYDLEGRNVIIHEMDTNAKNRDFFENIYPVNNSVYHTLVLAGNIDLIDFETDITSLPAGDDSLDLITLQRI